MGLTKISATLELFEQAVPTIISKVFRAVKEIWLDAQLKTRTWWISACVIHQSWYTPWQRIHGMRFKEVSGVGLWVEYTLPGKPWLAAILAAWCGTRKRMETGGNLWRSNDSFKQIRLHACVFRLYSIIFITMVTIQLCSHCPYDLFLPSTFASSRIQACSSIPSTSCHILSCLSSSMIWIARTRSLRTEHIWHCAWRLRSSPRWRNKTNRSRRVFLDDICQRRIGKIVLGDVSFVWCRDC